MRLHPDADQVVGLEHFDRLLFGQSHNGFLYATSILAAIRPETVRVRRRRKVRKAERTNPSPLTTSILNRLRYAPASREDDRHRRRPRPATTTALKIETRLPATHTKKQWRGTYG
jgi:hypothetical protein